MKMLKTLIVKNCYKSNQKQLFPDVINPDRFPSSVLRISNHIKWTTTSVSRVFIREDVITVIWQSAAVSSLFSEGPGGLLLFYFFLPVITFVLGACVWYVCMCVCVLQSGSDSWERPDPSG